MSGSTALQVCSTPYRLIAIARSQSAGSESTKGLALSQPALLTRTSTRPNCRTTRSTIAWTAWRSLTSERIATAPGSASRCPLRAGLVQVGDDDGRTLGGQLAGDCLTDALAGAGHDRDLVVEPAHQRLLSGLRPSSRPILAVVTELNL